jgi:hypothetical protein
MASPVKDDTAIAEGRFPGASVSSRGRGWIEHAHPSEPNRFIFQSQAGGAGWHFGDGPFTEANEIDTQWVTNDNPSFAQYELKMELADYNAYAGQDAAINFDAANIIKYVHPSSGEELDIFPFPDLAYTNDLDQLQVIGSVQQVGGTVDDDRITWSDAYGTGFDFIWQTQTVRLFKALKVDSRSSFPNPTQTILDGGNPVLKLELQFQKSSGVEIWVNGALWDEKANNPQITTDNVEFRLASTGEVLWGFRFPLAWDTGSEIIDPETIRPLMRLEKRAINLFVKILTPWTWIDNANYPIIIDASVNPQVGASTDDSFEVGNGSCSPTATTGLVNSPDPEHAAARWALSVPKDATINTSYTSWWTGTADRPLEYDVKIESADTAAVFTDTNNDISSRSFYSAVDWSGETTTADAFHDTPSLNTPIGSLTSRSGWSSGNYMCCAFTESSGESAGMIVHFYDNSSAEAPKAYVDYTSGDGRTTKNTDSYGLGIAAGLSRVVKTGGL